ncbi:MAG TPA: PilZ domain-containing protein [Planctomycetes bacterium]|nr:PilZ domain-containing protein [Planctomycetota bacterium]
MSAFRGFDFDGGAGKKPVRGRPQPPPAKNKVPARPTEVFKTVAIPKPIREPEDFKPDTLDDGNHIQRTHVRVRVYDNVLVAYKFLRRRDGAALSEVIKGKLLDISEGGLQFEGPKPSDIDITSLQLGDVLVGVNVFLPYVDGRMKVLGQVTWEKDGEQDGMRRLGVRFLDMDDAAKAMLKAYFISSQMPARKKRAPRPD